MVLLNLISVLIVAVKVLQNLEDLKGDGSVNYLELCAKAAVDVY